MRVERPITDNLVSALQISDEELLNMETHLISLPQKATPHDRELFRVLRTLSTLQPSILPPSILEMGSMSKLHHVLEIATNSNEPVSIHNNNTYIEFHHLIYAVITGYCHAVRSLKYLNKENLENPHLPKSKKTATKTVQLLGFVLWKITCSSIFSQHMFFLNRAGFIRAPQPLPIETGSDGDMDDSLMSDEAMEEEEQILEGAGGKEDQYVSQIPDSQKHALLLVRWTRLLVDHFSSLDYLTRYVGKRATMPVRIHLLAVSMASNPLTVPWNRVLDNALQRGHPLSSKERIEKAIMDRINLMNKVTSADGVASVDNWLHVGSRTRFNTKSVTLRSNVHCEAALAALIKHFQAVDPSIVQLFPWMSVRPLSLFSFLSV